MSGLYLDQVHLKDFRTFGDFKIDLPPCAGLTLLVGTNGLGKSNFFDGIEWGLTGTVRRFKDYVGRLHENDYLKRRDAPSNAHRVSLGFNDGSSIIRGGGLAPVEATITDLLKKPDWTDIHSLSAYFAFTHFLGQAAQQRFTSREQSEQWEALKGPSGIDRLESMRNALRGKKTMNAFKRRSERQELAVQAAEQALAGWRDRTDRLLVLRERASVAGADPINVLESKLATLERTAPGEPEAGAAIPARLVAVRQRIADAARSVEADQAELPGLRVLAERYTAAMRQTNPSSEHAVAVQGRLEFATGALSAAAIAASNLERDVASQTELAAQAEFQVQDLTRIRALLAERADLAGELDKVIKESAALEAERVAQEQSLAGAREAVKQAQEAQRLLASLETNEANWRRWSERITELSIRDAEARVLREAVGPAVETARAAADALPDLQSRVELAAAAEHDQAAKLERVKDEATGLASLLSGIAEHIEHDDQSCPVCASQFPPGRLKELALAAVSAQNARLAAEGQKLDELRTHHRDVLELISARRAQISAAAAADATATAAESAAVNGRRTIVAALGLTAEVDVAAHVANQLRAISEARTSKIGELAGVADVSTAQVQADALERALVSLSERVTFSAQRRVTIDSRLRAIDADLPGDSQAATLDALDVAMESRRLALTLARDRLVELQSARATAISEESTARERLAAAQGERDRLAVAVAEAEMAMSETQASWRSAGFEGAPNLGVITRREDALLTRAAGLAGQLSEQGALAAGYETFSAQEQLLALQAVMEVGGGVGAADDPSGYELTLQAALESARAALRRTSGTREAIVAYAEQLKDEAESFSSEFLLPLNDLIDAFNRALLSTPGETVQFNASHTVERTSLGMELRFSDEIDNAIYRTDVPPQLFLSEGQMAANGFSILCAASTAYPWSRWRALLLDDPLQHNDIIHAAAFVDVMRNLVELEGYQLLMSSHKRDEGDFIARKFDAAGLPCTVIALTAASKDGVLFDPPRYNAAARQRLSEAHAQAG